MSDHERDGQDRVPGPAQHDGMDSARRWLGVGCVLLRERDAAVYLGVQPSTLRSWRLTARRSATRGPDFIRFGRAVRYRLSDLDAWLDAHRCVSTGRLQDTASQESE